MALVLRPTGLPTGSYIAILINDRSQPITCLVSDEAGGSGPGGLDGQIQFNDNGSFGGFENLLWDDLLGNFQAIGQGPGGTFSVSEMQSYSFTHAAGGMSVTWSGVINRIETALDSLSVWQSNGFGAWFFNGGDESGGQFQVAGVPSIILISTTDQIMRSPVFRVQQNAGVDTLRINAATEASKAAGRVLAWNGTENVYQDPGGGGSSGTGTIYGYDLALGDQTLSLNSSPSGSGYAYGVIVGQEVQGLTQMLVNVSQIGGAGAGISLAIYDGDGVLLARTDEVEPTATGVLALPLTVGAPLTIPANTVIYFYAGVLMNGLALLSRQNPVTTPPSRPSRFYVPNPWTIDPVNGVPADVSSFFGNQPVGGVQDSLPYMLVTVPTA